MSALPIVAIVGRANVGKSSLFNRIVGGRQAIEADQPGTTRDPVYREVDIDGRGFLLIDTAGLKSPDDEFEMSIQNQITEAADVAEMIIVVVEATTDITDEDRRAAKLALKSKKPVILAINKIDQLKKRTLDSYKKLGIKTMIPTSAIHNQGISELISNVFAIIPEKAPSRGSDLTVAILGRPNVGKSAMFNALGNKQQAIVSDIQGTTRDVNYLDTQYHSKRITWLDTAGIRRSGKIEQGIEQFSVLRSIQAISEADVCLLLIDANEYNTKLDQKIAGMAKDALKPLILVISKWDSIEKDAYTRDQMAKEIALDYQFVNWAPLIITSSVTGQNITKLFELVLDTAEQAKREFDTSDLNDWLQEAMKNHPAAGVSTYKPKLKYAVQVGHKPPRIKIFGRDAEMIHWSYKRYLERTLRQRFDLTGTPVSLIFGSDKVAKDDPDFDHRKGNKHSVRSNINDRRR